MLTAVTSEETGFQGGVNLLHLIDLVILDVVPLHPETQQGTQMPVLAWDDVGLQGVTEEGEEIPLVPVHMSLHQGDRFVLIRSFVIRRESHAEPKDRRLDSAAFRHRQVDILRLDRFCPDPQGPGQGEQQNAHR